jgi:hypothetical protein
MDSQHRLWLGVGIVCAFAAGSARAAYADAPSDPCALLTPAQISTVVGATVAAGQPIGATGCSWTATAPTNRPGPKVMVTISLMDVARYDSLKTAPTRFRGTPLSGVGDDAVYATAVALTTLSVKTGAVAFIVRLYGVQGTDKQMAMEKALALDMLVKL